MATKPRMLFREIDGSPVPVSPFDARGTPIAANGSTLLGIEQAMERFDAERLALVMLYRAVMENSLAPDVLADLIRVEGGARPAP